jgi:NAD(P)-dependent dehydrogenase (short-subunit alcohol dehydrogenase family)
MKGKIVLVTGATSGIGKIAAQTLASMGAQVVALGRSREKLAGLKGMETLQCDLASLPDIRRAANEFRERFKQLHVLLNNAGAINAARELTSDGYERTFAVNHLAYFALTNELLELLKTSAPARIVNVASQASRVPFSDVKMDDLQFERRRWTQMRAYAMSKRLNLLFTFDLARRLEGTGVTVNAVHPGTVYSGFGNGTGLLRYGIELYRPFMLTPEQGAQTLIWLCSSPDVEGITGKYYYKKRQIRAVSQTYNQDVQRALWDESARLVTRATSSARAAS